MNKDTIFTDVQADIEGKNEKLMRWGTYVSVMAALIMIIIKAIAYLMTSSVAILSSLVDSLLDLITSTVNLFAVRHALEPADREHRYGHGKAESIAGLVQAAFISGSSVLLIFEVASRLLHKQAIENGIVGIAVMIMTIVITALLVKFQRYIVNRTGSIALKADSLHYTGDLLFNLGVIISLVLSTYFGWYITDPLFALIVVFVLFKGAYEVTKQSLAQLMDEELSDDIREQIRTIALHHPNVINLHELRTRSSGRKYFIQLHLEMDGELKLREAHQIACDVEHSIYEAFPNAEIIIHQDMEGLEVQETR